MDIFEPDPEVVARYVRYPLIWHKHGRPVIGKDTPPHVHAHHNGDDVEHLHEGLSEVIGIGR